MRRTCTASGKSFGWTALALGLALAGCKKTEPSAPPAPKAEAEAKATVSPVYPAKPKSVPDTVKAICAALHDVPQNRKAACCGSAGGVVLTDECERNLAGAVEQGGLTIDAALVKTCTTALARTFEGCAWVGPHMPPIPDSCPAALVGQRAEGEVCKSTLECEGGMRCAGSSPTDAGKCRPAAPAGKLCNTGVDALAPYLRIDAKALRPSCQDGFCDKNVCRNHVGAGGDCQASVQCGTGLRCAGGRCIDGAKGTVDAPCTGGDCAEGLRCVAQTCTKPRPAGAPCSKHAQCQGACLDGACKMVCSAAELLRALPAANTPPKPVLKPHLKKIEPPKGGASVK